MPRSCDKCTFLPRGDRNTSITLCFIRVSRVLQRPPSISLIPGLEFGGVRAAGPEGPRSGPEGPAAREATAAILGAAHSGIFISYDQPTSEISQDPQVSRGPGKYLDILARGLQEIPRSCGKCTFRAAMMSEYLNTYWFDKGFLEFTNIP